MQDAATINIGKAGLTAEQANHVKAALKAKGLIKIKILKNARGEENQILEQILFEAKAKLVKKIGFTFIIRKNGE